MTATLDEYLEANCRYLELAIKDVAARRDLPPVFAFMKADGAGVLPVTPEQFDDKPTTAAIFRGLLKAVGAEQYAIITSAWVVRLEREEVPKGKAIIDREGTGGVYRNRRQECYVVTVGDRDRTLMVMFDVERDYKGKIRHLKRRPTPAGFSHGRFIDLLAEPRH